MQYYSYYLQIRDLDQITVNNFGRLAQQYIVHQYSKVEMQRLNYFRSNQHAIRADLYNNLYSLNKSDSNLRNVGKKIILSSSFNGGPRNMHELYQDAMGLIRTYGKPDLFITFTCNPNWAEISELEYKLGINYFSYRYVLEIF